MKKIILFLIFTCAVFGQLIVNAPGGIVIQLDTTDGFFGIGDTAGRRLMFNFNYPESRQTSPFIVMIDSSLYTNSPEIRYFCGSTLLRPYRRSTATFYNGFSIQWDIPLDTLGGTMLLTQQLRSMIIDAMPAVEISYMVYNNSDFNHRVAFYLNIDVMVGSNDRAPMVVGASYTGLGDILTGLEIPYFWMAFERGPSAGISQVVARGMLRGIATRPEFFAFGSQRELFNDCWDPDPAIIGRPYDDSGVSMRWHESQVSPGKTHEVKTIYGFGKAIAPGSDMIVMPLIPNSVGSACDRWAQNPFEAALLVNNVGRFPSIDSVIACIHVPDGLRITSDAFHPSDTCVLLSPRLLPDSTELIAWLVWVDTLYFTTETEVPLIISLSSPSFSTDIAETTFVEIPRLGGVNPTITAINSPINAISCRGIDFPLRYVISDDEGINPTSLILRVGPQIKYYNDTTLTWSGDTLTMQIPFFYLIHGHKIHHGVISVSDSDGCIPDSIPYIKSFWVDLLPPIVGPPYPPDRSSISNPLTPVSIPLFDWPAGIDTLTISVSINIDGTEIYYSIFDPELFYSDSTLFFAPSTPWPDSSVITFCLRDAADYVDARFCPVHRIADTVCTTFWVIYSDIDELEKPDELSLRAYPNPFNTSVTIHFSNAEKFDIFDISGRLVSNISRIIGNRKTGWFVWDGTTDSGEILPNGIYFARISNGEKHIVERLILLK